MNRLGYYLARAMCSMSLAVLVVLTGLASLFTLVDELRGKDASILQATLYTLLELPAVLNDAWVVAMIAGCTIAISLLMHSKELLMLYAGLGLRRLLYTALLPGLAAGAICVLNAEYLLPFTAELKQEQRTGIKRSSTDTLHWFRAGSRHVHVERILPGGRLEGIHIYEYAPESTQLIALGYADGAWLRDDLWAMEGLRSYTLDEHGATRAHATPHRYLPVPQQVNTLRIAPESLSMQFLYKHIRRLDAQGADNARYTRTFWSKLLRPMVLPLTGLLSLALVLGTLRSRTYSLKAALGALLGILYYAVDHTAYYLGVVHAYDPLVCAAAAPGLLLATTLVLLRRLRRPGGGARA